VTVRIVLMGVAGSGKTTVGEALAFRLGIPYRDGDLLHPPANIAKMTRGEALNDDDRWPWLAAVGQTLRREAPVIVGCSALKRSYRDKIRDEAGADVTFVHLAGTRAIIEARMAARTNHFMPASLVPSQFAALEPPAQDEQSVTVNIGQPLGSLVEEIAARLGAAAQPVERT
jgi:gluconokinase